LTSKLPFHFQQNLRQRGVYQNASSVPKRFGVRPQFRRFSFLPPVLQIGKSKAAEYTANASRVPLPLPLEKPGTLRPAQFGCPAANSKLLSEAFPRFNRHADQRRFAFAAASKCFCLSVLAHRKKPPSEPGESPARFPAVAPIAGSGCAVHNVNVVCQP